MRLRHATGLAAAAVLTFATLTGVASLAHADTGGTAQSRTIRYDDLNLSTPVGIQTLYLRIQGAARDACGSQLVTGTRLASARWKDCVTTSIREAVLAVNKPGLTAYYAAHLHELPSRTDG